MIRHYVEFFYPGVICTDTSEREVLDRYPSSLNVPENAFGFRFFDREVVETLSGEELKGEKKNFSSNYYYGERYSLAEIKNYMPDKKVLIANMEGNNFPAVVKTRFGQFMPLRHGDIVL